MFPKLIRTKIEKCAERDDKVIQKLYRDFQAVRAVLDEEENRKQLKENDVEDLLVDIDDSLDELMLLYSKIRKVRSSLSFYLFSRRRRDLRRNVALNLENLRQKPGVKNWSLQTSDVKRDELHREIEPEPAMISVIDSKEVFGRDVEITRVRDFLLSESSHGPTLPTMSIVGIEGIGKTTLARCVFDSDDVKTHFAKRLWVCASYPFDEIRVAKAILESLKDGTSNLVEMEIVLQQISKSIEKMKFFLVLDDVRIEDLKYWEQMKYALKSGYPGSRILVTTREESASNKCSETISLGGLSEEASWLLFRQVSLFEEGKNLEEIGRNIVGKCEGLPFAIKIIGSLLRFKKSPEEWRSVLDSEIWVEKEERKKALDRDSRELEELKDPHFLALLLSYRDLPSPLKKCLSYCAVFPKNYEIEKDRLIKLWMSQGYLKVEGREDKVERREDMELIGEKYFENLAMRSFFQEFQMNEYDGRIIRCKMHDIVHDFALEKNRCFTLLASDSVNGKLEYQKPQHLMIMFDREASFPIPFCQVKKVRSLFVESAGGYMTGISLSDLFDKLTCLRALDLSNQDNICYKVIKEVPRGIDKMIHLRYLNLSYNSQIKKLPETLCKLYNLESVELSWCVNLKKLPQRMGKLINMRHIVNDQTSLSYLPKGIEDLTCLQTLSEFIVGGVSDDGEACELGCLKNLNDLRGSLRIKGLGNVNEKDINNGELQKKKNLLDLYLSFEKDEEKGRKNADDKIALERLQLPLNLDRLEISYYRGNKISLTSILSLTKLRWMSLHHCMNLVQLPHLGELPSLESLTIRKTRRLEKVGIELLRENPRSSTGEPFAAFPKLKLLEFQKMEAWTEWKFSVGTGEKINIMPCLRSLTVGFCPNLEALPHDYFPQTLEKLKIVSCPKLNDRNKEWIAGRQKISHMKVSFD